MNVEIVGGRIQFTAMRCGDVGVHISRFERRAVRIHPPEDLDPEGVVVIRLEKPAPVEYNLKRRGRVYFNHTAQKWFAHTKDNQEIVFLPELVGVRYLTNREWMEKFGFVIAGEDVRSILFRVLYDNRKDLLQPPLTLTGEVNKKGDVLCAYAKELWEEHADWFTPEERDLINEYLGTR